MEAFLIYSSGDQKDKENVRKDEERIVNKPENILASAYLQLNAALASHLKKTKKSTVKDTEVYQSYFLKYVH